MNSDLDSRIHQLQERRRASGKATEEAVAGLDHLVHDASEAVKELDAKTNLIAHRTGQLELKLQNLRRTVAGGLATTLVVAFLVIVLAMWMGARIRQAAVDEAYLLREQNAAVVEQIRQDGEEEIAAMRAQNAEQRDRAEREVAEAGADLAGMMSELEAGRAELEQFVALKERAGFNLIDHRGRTVIIVAEGQEIRSWRVPGLSNLARYNGQMYQIFD